MGDAPSNAVGRFEPVLRARANRLIGPRLRPIVAPSDLLQETLLAAVRRYAELSGRPPRLVLSWLLSTMRFRLMRYVRDHRAAVARRGPGGSASGEATRSSSLPLHRIVREEVRQKLLGLIDTLPEAERKVVVLIHLEHRTTSEVAAELGRTEGAVRALHQRAIRRLREGFGAESS